LVANSSRCHREDSNFQLLIIFRKKKISIKQKFKFLKIKKQQLQVTRLKNSTWRMVTVNEKGDPSFLFPLKMKRQNIRTLSLGN
jgi:hypothetical protein